ncbi:endo-alpha-N-acetylgalactosaminidase, partial [Streptomyces sp. OspMP-M43]
MSGHGDYSGAMSPRFPRPGLVAAASAAVLALVGAALPAAAADPSPAPAGAARPAGSAVIGSDRLPPPPPPAL